MIPVFCLRLDFRLVAAMILIIVFIVAFDLVAENYRHSAVTSGLATVKQKVTFPSSYRSRSSALPRG